VEEIEAKGTSIRSTAKTLGRALNRKRDGKNAILNIGPPVLSKEELQTTTLSGRANTDKSLAMIIAAAKKRKGRRAFMSCVVIMSIMRRKGGL
tara:strand:+ start:305 stop:583 length:279 start_codon:yes stop_codon:yes gene_type:complete